MSWYLLLTVGFAVGSIYGSLMTLWLRRHRDRQAGNR